MAIRMTLSEALRRIKVLKGDIARWSRLLPTSNTWDEDNKPTYGVVEVLENIDKATAELIQLKTLLSEANTKTSIPFHEGLITLTEVVARLTELKARMTLLEALPTFTEQITKGSRVEHSGTGYATITFDKHCVITTRARDEQLAALRNEFNALNGLLEAANNRILLTDH